MEDPFKHEHMTAQERCEMLQKQRQQRRHISADKYSFRGTPMTGSRSIFFLIFFFCNLQPSRYDDWLKRKEAQLAKEKAQQAENERRKRQEAAEKYVFSIKMNKNVKDIII